MLEFDFDVRRVKLVTFADLARKKPRARKRRATIRLVDLPAEKAKQEEDRQVAEREAQEAKEREREAEIERIDRYINRFIDF
jgi:hypothetical protein